MKKYMITLLALPLLALAACNDNADAPTPTPPAQSGVVDGTFVGKFARFEKGRAYEGRTVREWTDTVWANERVHQQIMLTTAEGTVEGLFFEVSDLSSADAAIPAENISLRTVGYVLGDAQALVDGAQTNRADIYIGDALLESVATSVSVDDPLKLWLTIEVPKDTPAGRYSGTIAVKQGETNLLMFDITLIVTAHSLPDVADRQFRLDLWQFPFQLASHCGVEPFTEQYYRLVEPFYRLLAEAGQKSVTTYIKDGAFARGQTMVDWTLGRDGVWRYDYSKFDAYVEFMAGLGIDTQINCFSPAGWNKSLGYTDEASGKYLYKLLSLGSEEYNAVWNAFLTDFRSHLLAKGWFDKAVLYMDENPEAEMTKIVDMITANCPDWKIGLAGREINTALERRFHDYSTIIGYDRKATNNTVATFYTSCSQSHPNNYVSLETETAEMTWMGWHALAKGFNGYARWAYDYWTLTDPFDARDGANTAGDFSMIYRSDNTPNAQPVSSIRFEMLRDGIQDYEKVRILGASKIRGMLQLFADASAPDAKANVLTAQAKLKQMSVK